MIIEVGWRADVCIHLMLSVCQQPVSPPQARHGHTPPSARMVLHGGPPVPGDGSHAARGPHHGADTSLLRTPRTAGRRDGPRAVLEGPPIGSLFDQHAASSLGIESSMVGSLLSRILVPTVSSFNSSRVFSLTIWRTSRGTCCPSLRVGQGLERHTATGIRLRCCRRRRFTPLGQQCLPPALTEQLLTPRRQRSSILSLPR